jgi:CubicO group peptidase (beta-lactamase class C family)
VEEMRVDRGTPAGGPAYGFGWWITLPEDGSDPTLFSDTGMYGTVAWIDIERGYGGYLALEASSSDGTELYSRIRPLIESAIDEFE